jgi:cysteine-rich repeat protein
MKKKNKLLVVLGVILLISILVVGAYFLINNLPQQTTVGGNIVQYAIPHFASFKCEELSDRFGIEQTIPEEGLLISRSTVGFYTNGIQNVKTEVDYNFWTSLIKDLRLRYKYCDVNGNNCGEDHIIKYVMPGPRQAVLNSLNFETQSLRVYFEQQRLAEWLVGDWSPYEGAKISYDGTEFALRVYSTTQDPAGKVVCSTGCDLDCPTLSYRQNLIYDCNGNDECENMGEEGYDTSDILGFYKTAPYFEYWETIDYDLNSQGGATIYDSSSNTFCFVNSIYDANTITINGKDYVYPDGSPRHVTCCNGARIVSSYSTKECRNNQWVTISGDDELTCMSSINCPGAGNPICQNKQFSSGYICTNKDSNGYGICISPSTINVECCTASDCAEDMACDTNTHKCVGGSSNPTCGDKKVDVGEECDDGNNADGDGCSASCEIESGNGNKTCPYFWQEYHQETEGALWGLFPGEPAGCYTANWVFFTIGGVIFFLLIIVLALIFKKKESSNSITK